MRAENTPSHTRVILDFLDFLDRPAVKAKGTERFLDWPTPLRSWPAAARAAAGWPASRRASEWCEAASSPAGEAAAFAVAQGCAAPVGPSLADLGSQARATAPNAEPFVVAHAEPVPGAPFLRRTQPLGGAARARSTGMTVHGEYIINILGGVSTQDNVELMTAVSEMVRTLTAPNDWLSSEMTTQRSGVFVMLGGWGGSTGNAEHPSVMAAARNGRAIELAKLLAESPSRASEIDRDGETALMKAAAHGHLSCVTLLLPHSDRAAVDGRGMTALMHAARGVRSHSSPSASALCVATLLADGFDARATDKRGRTALMFAAFNGRADAVRHLLAHSDPLARSDERSSALMLAATDRREGTGEGRRQCVQLLLPCSDLQAFDSNGQTALKLAVKSRDAVMAESLAEHADALSRRGVLNRFGPERLPRLAALCEADQLRAVVCETAPNNEQPASASKSPNTEPMRGENQAPARRATRRI